MRRVALALAVLLLAAEAATAGPLLDRIRGRRAGVCGPCVPARPALPQAMPGPAVTYSYVPRPVGQYPVIVGGCPNGQCPTPRR